MSDDRWFLLFSGIIMDVKDFTKFFEKSARAVVDADGEMMQLVSFSRLKAGSMP